MAKSLEFSREKRLAPKTIFTGTIGKGLFDANAEKGTVARTAVPLFRVTGIARTSRVGDSQFGPYVEFDGDFGAVDLATGKGSRAAKLILPDEASDQLRESLGSGPVKFAYEIGIKKSDKGNGFDYTVRVLEKPTAADEISELVAAHLVAAPAVPPAKK